LCNSCNMAQEVWIGRDFLFFCKRRLTLPADECYNIAEGWVVHPGGWCFKRLLEKLERG